MTNKHLLGLTTGTFAALLHACWGITLWLGFAGPLANWLMAIHHVQLTHDFIPFNLGTVALLVVVAFAIGYVTGWIFGAIWNWTHK